MGGLLGRNRNARNDPFYNAVPPSTKVGPTQYDPNGGLDVYDPFTQYAREYGPILTMQNYGQLTRQQRQTYGGRYAQGFNQMPGTTPWNYGNYYLGNTTMQMMPMTLNKVAEYGEMQARAALANAGILGNKVRVHFNMPMSQSAPMMPMCTPSSFNMPITAPMAASATPLPIAFNPLVQGMFPAASANPVNWMTPSSFMSALTTGPMPYRPPAYDFPNNVGMVMTIPYGTPNPLLSPNSFGSSYSSGQGSSWCCCYNYSMPSQTASAYPSVSYYPQSVSVPEPYSAPYPVPYPVPVAMPNIQQLSAVQPTSALTPPTANSYNPSVSTASEPSFGSSQCTITNVGFVQPTVMSSNQQTSAPISIPLNNSQPTNIALPVYDATDKSQQLIGSRILSGTSNFPTNNVERSEIIPNTVKYENPSNQTSNTIFDRIRRHIPSIHRLSISNYNFPRSQPRSEPVLPPILNGYVISDSGWLPKTSQSQLTPNIKPQKRLLQPNESGKSASYSLESSGSFIPRRRRRRDHSGSSTSEYDCVICQQKREKRRLQEYYSSSTVSSLLSSKGSRRQRLVSNESFPSSKHSAQKPHRRHEKRIKAQTKSASSQKSSSPVLIRKSPISELLPSPPSQRQQTRELREEEEEEEEKIHEKEEPSKRSFVHDDDDATIEKSEHHGSEISFRTTED